MKKPVPTIINNLLKFEKHGYTLHSNWHDQLWLEFSNFFKYAASIKGRDVSRNEEHLLRYKRYYETYKNKVKRMLDMCSVEKKYVFPDDPRADIVSSIDTVARRVLEKSATVYDLMQLHIDVTSVLHSYSTGKPILYYVPKGCYGENALTPRPKHHNYFEALERVIRVVECKMDDKDDFLFVSEDIADYIRNFCIDGESMLYW